MNGTSRKRLLEDLKNKEARDAYVGSHVRSGPAYQIRAMRNARGWSQGELGRLMGEKPQSTVARLENPDYGQFSMSTLLEVASAFDVALLVRFVSYSDFLRLVTDATPGALAPLQFSDDTFDQPTEAAIQFVAAAQVSSDRQLIGQSRYDWRRNFAAPHNDVILANPYPTPHSHIDIGGVR